MHQRTIDYSPTINVEAFIGLTPWMLTTVCKPPTTGWWKTRRASSPELLQPQRRWWDGRQWSMPVLLVNTDEDAEDFATLPALASTTDIEWCGLLAPHPAGYSYRPMRI